MTPVNLAVADKIGRTTSFTAHHSGAGHLAGAGAAVGERVEVDTLTLDAFVLEQGNRAPNFIKMDVEGAEGSVLAGGMKVLEAHRPILLIDLHNPQQDLVVGKVLLDLGYAAFRSEDGSRIQHLDRCWPDPVGV